MIYNYSPFEFFFSLIHRNSMKLELQTILGKKNTKKQQKNPKDSKTYFAKNYTRQLEEISLTIPFPLLRKQTRDSNVAYLML